MVFILSILTLQSVSVLGWKKNLGQKARGEDVTCLNRSRKVCPEGLLQAGLFAKAKRVSAVFKGQVDEEEEKGEMARSLGAQPFPA